MPATRSPKITTSKGTLVNVFPKVKSTRNSSKKSSSRKTKKARTPTTSPIESSSSGEEDVVKEENVDPSKLNVKGYTTYHKSLTSKSKFGRLPLIHCEDENAIHQILRTFDMTVDFGPYVGITRLNRWNRAQKLGLNPPPEVKQILETDDGRNDDHYAQNVLHFEGV